MPAYLARPARPVAGIVRKRDPQVQRPLGFPRSRVTGMPRGWEGLTDTARYPILWSIRYHSVSREDPMSYATTSAPGTITAIGKREAQVWLLKRSGSARRRASRRQAHADQKAHEPERDVAA